MVLCFLLILVFVGFLAVLESVLRFVAVIVTEFIAVIFSETNICAIIFVTPFPLPLHAYFSFFEKLLELSMIGI